jgi:phosphate transport system protein
MKRFFHAELEDFRELIVLMGQRAADHVWLAVEALEERDAEKARRVIADDDRIDVLEERINSEVIRYISLRAPVATELRLLTLGMKAAFDLERVGDEATTIAKQARELAVLAHPLDLLDIPEMTNVALRMLREALQSFLNEDVAMAESIRLKDRSIDSMHLNNRLMLQKRMDACESPLDDVFPLIIISKAIERVGDHAKNLAEQVIQLHRGREPEPQPTSNATIV